jgi:hypothetical protein
MFDELFRIDLHEVNPLFLVCLNSPEKRLVMRIEVCKAVIDLFYFFLVVLGCAFGSVLNI